MRVLFIGCGFLGKAAAFLFSGRAHQVLVLHNGSADSAGTTDTADVAVVRKDGAEISMQHCDVTHPFAPVAQWLAPDVMVYCASTRGGDDEAYRNLYFAGLQRVQAIYHPQHTIFIGSTAVYGEHGGEWVSENSPVYPPDRRSQILLDAEGLAASGTILRLAGLYSQEHSAYLRKFCDGSARITHERWVNQIHRDDAAAAILLVGEMRVQGIFNVCDDTPMRERDLYARIAESRGGKLPPCAQEIVCKHPQTNKRISNSKLRSLGWTPEFPSFVCPWVRKTLSLPL